MIEDEKEEKIDMIKKGALSKRMRGEDKKMCIEEKRNE